PLGAGGMGQVYRARDSRLNRDVALKMLPPEYSSDPARKQRFEQEARAVAALNHPGILSIYDVGDGWMVTELVEGETLRKAQLDITQVIDVGAQIAEALAAAHDTGITHRDLKPENILLTPEGRTKILDFGLAQMVKPPVPGEAQEVRTVTNPGIPMGTPGYMAPEQVRGQAADHRADIFSLGVILYELLAGKPAFEGPSALEVMHAIVAEEPAELPENVPDGLRRIVKRCLEKRPAQRYQAARDLTFSLRSFGALTAASAAKVEVAAPAQRNLLRPLVGALIGLAIAGALAVVLMRAPAGADISGYHFTPFAYTEDQEYSGVWSPDGGSVAFIRQTSGVRRLMVQSLDATNPTQIASPADQPVWAPDGSRIYYLGRGGVMNVSPAGGQPEAVLQRATAFHISPDGKSMAVWRANRPQDPNRPPDAKGAQEEGRQYSVWISSPPGAAPVEYKPAPFAVKTP
ncbi:MAG: protein kinase domain-containing protein, partial [Bryobacteraceae bacterium]